MRYLKRGILLVFLILVSINNLNAQPGGGGPSPSFPIASVSAPSSVNPGDEFTVEVTGYTTGGTYIDKLEIKKEDSDIKTCTFSNECGTSSSDLCSCTINQIENQENIAITYSGFAYMGLDSASSQTTVSVGNEPPSFESVTIPSTVNSGSEFDVIIDASDQTGLSSIQVIKDQTTILEQLCNNAQTCQLSKKRTETVAEETTITYTIKAEDTSGDEITQTHDIEVTVVEKYDPVFGDFDPLTGVVDELYEGVIQASDDNPDDTLTFSEEDVPPWITVHDDGSVTGTPPETGEFKLKFKVTDQTVEVISDEFTLTVHECQSGDILDTTCGDGECSGNTGQKVCEGGSWGDDSCDPMAGASDELCDNGLDDDCDGATDDSDDDCGGQEGTSQYASSICEAGDTTQIFCGQGVCRQKYQVHCVNSVDFQTCSDIDEKLMQPPESDDDRCDGLDNDCDGSIDEDCDKDDDGYCSNSVIEGVGCPNGRGDCNDNNNNVYPGAEEVCNEIDDNCDGNIDEGDVCDECNFLRSGLGLTAVDITAVTTSATPGQSISFEATENMDSYIWDFGDGSSGNGQSVSHAFNNPGTYTVRVDAFVDGCSESDSVSVTIACDGDCVDDDDGSVSINIISPKDDIYATENVPLDYRVSPSDTMCAFSLNGDSSYTVLDSSVRTLRAKEGHNTLTIKCEDQQASVTFTINTEDNSLFDELKGNLVGESIFDLLKDDDEQKLSKEEAQKVLISILDEYDFSIEKLAEPLEGRTRLTLLAENTIPVTMKSFSMVAKIPKNIAATADNISSDQMYEVVEHDPVLRFPFASIAPGDLAQAIFVVDGDVTQEMLDQISVEPKIDIDELLEIQQKTQEGLKITRDFEEFQKDGETYTKIRIKLNPKRGVKDMADLTLYEKIPKCLARHIDDIKMDEEKRQLIKVLNPDPLVMWQFDKLESEKEFTYEVKGVLSEDCKKQIAALGLAEELGIVDERSLWMRILPLLIIPLIGMLIVYVEKFAPRGKPSPQPAPQEQPKPEAPKPEVPKFEQDIDKEIENATKNLEESLNKPPT
ncbi:PKD domain-containing protein [Thermoproteota archaeon]